MIKKIRIFARVYVNALAVLFQIPF